ncbi:MAG: RNA polymerase sigma factor [Myxococcales bacterium]|nr:RNA polymerase sigma factor [Myxococcales bacterium]
MPSPHPPRSRASPDRDLGPLYERYRGMIRRRLGRFAPDEIAEELTNEAFTVAMSRRSQFRGGDEVSWLYQIATRLGLHHVRDTARRHVLLETHGPPAWAVPISESPVEARVFLHQIWARLDDELTEIGVYHYLDGMTHHEIARLMGCSRRTVGNRIATLTALVREAARTEEDRD